MAKKTKEEAERTYHALLDAAALLFIRQGVAKTTLNNIAVEAGVTRGAVYHHFDNKDVLIQRLWERNGCKLQQALNELITKIALPNPAANFRIAINSLIRTILKEPDLSQVMRIITHNVEFTEEETELQCFLLSKKEEYHSIFKNVFIELKKHKVLRGKHSPDLLAYGLRSYLFGLIHDYLSPGQIKLTRHKDVEALVNLFLDALLIE